MTLGYRFPPGPPSEVDLGRLQWRGKGKKMGKEGKMMRKTMEKRRDFDIKQWKKWESNGKFE